jgi:predicted RNase H-like HicB family nuclease
MIRKYSLIVEGDDDGYSGYVPELPTILVTGRSMEDLTTRAKEAIRIYYETLHADRSPASTVREIEVEVPV